MSKCHRITESGTEQFGLEETLKLIQLCPSAMGTDTSQTRPAQRPIQPGLKNLQGWGMHVSSGQPVPVSKP